MSDGPSRAEFEAFTARLYHTMDAGFTGVHQRLDVLNGRTLKGEVDRENLRTRIVGLEKETFTREKNRRRQDTAGAGEAWAGAFTKREYGLMVLGFGGVGVGFKVILWLLEKVWYLLTHGGVAG